MKIKAVTKLWVLTGLVLAAGLLKSAAAQLTWSGTGNPSTNWDVGLTANWKNGAISSFFNTGDSVLFNDNGITTTINLTTNVQPAAVTVDSVLRNYSFSGGTNAIVGAAAFLKNGTSTLTLNSSNGFTGGLTISNGIVTLGNGYAAGSGIITLAGGTLNLGTTITPGNTLSNVANSTITGGSAGGLVGIYKVTGSNTLNIAIPSGVFDFKGDMTTFSGTVAFGSSANNLRLNGATGSSLATFDLGTGTLLMSIRNGATAIALGGLAGAGNGTTLAANSSANYGATFTIGANNASTTFAGKIANGSAGAGATTAINKVGTGTLTLSGTNNSYTGATTVNGGVLAVSGSAWPANSTIVDVTANGVLDVSGMAGGMLTLGAGQTLKGAGTIRGSLVVPAGAILLPGDGVGVLTVTNAVTLGGSMVMELNLSSSPATNDMLSAASITGGGTLLVTNLGPALQAGNTFKLFSQAVSGIAVTLATNDASGASYTWSNKISVDGTIQVLTASSSVNPAPTNLVFSLSGNALQLSWPGDHKGWRLLTNAVSLASTNSWFPFPNSAAVTNVAVTVDPSKANVFFRLVYP